jgi:formate-dependent nitrite reductase membrane component NrfD
VTPPSSTFFTAGPGWHWLVVLYFFVGGLAGGSYALGVLIDAFGTPADRRLARLAYYVALPAILVSGLLLIFDLTRPLRFWHMLIQSETLRPMFKYWSPMSIGAWALLIFGAFALVAFLSALAETGALRWSPLRALRAPHPAGVVIGGLGAIFGLYVAGYTGVLLAVTNRPIWSDTNLLGFLFVVSAASISAALLLMLGHALDVRAPGLWALERFGRWTVVLELLVLAAFLASLGAVFRVWLSWWGLALLVGVVLVGMLLPLLVETRSRWSVRIPVAAGLVLVGGFLLRVVIVFTSEAL